MNHSIQITQLTFSHHQIGMVIGFTTAYLFSYLQKRKLAS